MAGYEAMRTSQARFLDMGRWGRLCRPLCAAPAAGNLFHLPIVFNPVQKNIILQICPLPLLMVLPQARLRYFGF